MSDLTSRIAQSLALSYGSHVSPPRGGKDYRAAEEVEALIREEIAAEIEAEHMTSPAGDETTAWNLAITNAVHIARGKDAS